MFISKKSADLFKKVLNNVSLLLLFLFSTSLLKDTLKQRLFKKHCEDFDSYLVKVLGSPALQPGFGISGEELGKSTLEPQKEISELVSNCHNCLICELNIVFSACFTSKTILPCTDKNQLMYVYF